MILLSPPPFFGVVRLEKKREQKFAAPRYHGWARNGRVATLQGVVDSRHR